MKPAAVKPPNTATWLVVAVAPVRLVAPVELPDSVPATNVPVWLIVPDVAISPTDPAPPSVTRPGIVTLAPLRITATALTVPSTVSEALSAIAAAVPPFAEPATSRLRPSFNVKPAALNVPIVAILLVVRSPR